MIPYTILRNNWYIDLDEGLLHAAKKTGRFLYTSHQNKYSFALRREYAEIGAKVFLREKILKLLTYLEFLSPTQNLEKQQKKLLEKNLKWQKFL